MDHDRYYNDGMYGMSGGGWMTAFAIVSLILLLIAVIAVVANLYLHVTHRPSPLLPDQPAFDARPILDTRLARGEISAEEYSSVRAVLDGIEPG